MPYWLIFTAAFVLSSAVALAAVGALLPRLRAWQVVDVPNARSSHTRITPRGGGLGVLVTVLPGWLLAWWLAGVMPENAAVVAAATLLAVICWIDDVRTIGPALRFGVQIVTVGVGLTGLDADQHVFGGYLPFFVDRVAAGICWLWFINLFNFMDGIDGLAATETIAVCLGVILLAFLYLGQPVLAVEALILAGAALGFLWWNWSPAKVFMGDVGSAPIGFLVGFLLMNLAAAGELAAALILPMYFAADATVTIFRRLGRGAKIWEPHREHAYQRAVQAGLSHRRVVGMVGAVNAAFVALAFASLYQPVAALAAALLIVSALFWYLSSRPARRSN